MANHKPAPKESRLIKAAGGVAWRPGPDGEPEILLVHRKKYDDWSLPKGKTEPGETLPVTAVREVLEEGGARLALGRRLISVRYNVGGRPKRVHYWAARVVSVDPHAVPNSEVDQVAWVRASGAVDKVSYSHDHGVLADFAARPVNTVPLILLRHAKAHSKSGWKRADIIRPLDDAGRSDAKALADLLACFDPGPQLISSPAARCLDTLRPFAELSGGNVREERSLYIHDQSSATDAGAPPADAATLVRQAIASGKPTVICAHRENIPQLQAAALAALTAPGSTGAGSTGPGSTGAGSTGAGLSAILPPPREWNEALVTASFWVLNIAPLPAADETEPTAEETEPTAETAGSPPGTRPAAGTRPQAVALAAPRTPGRRRWFRIPGRLSRAPFQTAAPATGAPAPAQARAEDADRPVGLLISADRYDLSEP